MLGFMNVIQTSWWDGRAEQEAPWDAGTPLWPASVEWTEGLLAEMPVPGAFREDSMDHPGNLPGGAGNPAEELPLLLVCCLLCAMRPVWNWVGANRELNGSTQGKWAALPGNHAHHAPPLASLLVSSTKFSSRAAGKEKCSWGPLLYHKAVLMMFF